MANFKRKKPKQARGGCLLCKPHKAMGNSKKYWSAVQMKLDQVLKEQIGELA